MFWDGERWGPEKGPLIRSKRPTSRLRLRRWLVAVPILFLMTALVVPVVSTEAATYHPRVVVGVAAPGGLVTLTGSGLRPGGYLQARLDRASTRLGLIRVNRRGRFSVQLRLPSTTTPGTHLVTIGRVSYGGLATARIRSTRLLAQTTILSVKVSVKRKGGVSKAAPPSPTPVPTPVPTRTPAPTGVAVPASIDSTGATDASAALNKWLYSVPDGGTIVFKAGGFYRMDRSLNVYDRHNLTFEGNGATLKSNGDGHEYSSVFQVFSDSGIKIRNFNLVGNTPTPGVFRSGEEGAYGVQIVGGSNIEVANVKISNTYGDCVMVDYWTDGVRFHDSTCKSSGRNGVAILAGKNVTVEHVAFDRNGGGVFDIEPYQSSGGAINVAFINNTSGTHSNGFFDANGGSVISNITVSGNTLTGGSLGGHVWLASPRVKNLVFTNNTGAVPAAGPVLFFSHVDGLTVTGNVQPLASGVLASITGSTGVTYR